MGSCNDRRPTFARRVAVVAVIVVVGALPVGVASADPPTPYLDEIARVLHHRSPGTQGKVWWLSKGNDLPQPGAASPGWLLQSVDCWGKSTCHKPPPGGASFVRKMEEMIAIAEKSVDIADLYQLKPFNPGYPDGGYLDAIVAGLKRGHREHPNAIPLVRLLLGVFPPGIADEQAFINVLERRVGTWVKVQSGSMRSAVYSWNHAKVVDVDGREAIVGGVNYWASDYLDTSHPTNDVSMWVKGPAATDVSRYMDVLWKFTCDNRLIPANGVTVRVYNTGGSWPLYNCIRDIPTDTPRPDPNGRTIMVVGKLGHGIPVPGEAGKESAPIVRPKLSGNTCNATQAREDNKDVNNKRDYEYRNPGETALRALIADAKRSIFISQQDLLSCLPKPAVATEAKFDERVFAALADKIRLKIPIKVVLSNPGGDYANGWELKDVAHVFMQMLVRNDGVSEGLARHLVCQDVGLTTIRNDANAATWQDGTRFYNHAKLVAVDDEAFYIGSGNLYPSGLQELGMIVDDHSVADQLKKAYLDPLWANSRTAALIDPQTNKCGEFPG